MRTSSASRKRRPIPDQVAEALADVKGYHLTAYSAEKAGYSGTAILEREKPVRVDHGIGMATTTTAEGRVITATFADHIVVNAYIPNSGQGLKRLDYRQQWDIACGNTWSTSLPASGP
jgi:exodeoxyribonuclease-3